MIENGGIREGPPFPQRGRKWKSCRKARLVRTPAALVWLRTTFELSWGVKLFTQQGNNQMVFTQVHACTLWRTDNTLRENVVVWARRCGSRWLECQLANRWWTAERLLYFHILVKDVHYGRCLNRIHFILYLKINSFPWLYAILQLFISCLSVTTSVYILYSMEGTQKKQR